MILGPSHLLFPLLLLVTSCQPATVLRGTLAGDLAWQGEVRIAGDLEIAAGSRLVIAPGTRVVFLPAAPAEDRLRDHPHFPGSELIVRGELVAEGTAEAPIVFRHLDPEAPPGSWGGINLVASPLASFAFCRFSQADSAVHSQESTVFVEESIFEHNLVGVRFHSSAMLIEHNLFRSNGTGIRFHFGAPVICNNVLSDNDKGIFVTSHPRHYHIENNTLSGNRRFAVVLGEEVPEDLAMPRNYWGTVDPLEIDDRLFDGRRESYLGRVLYQPLLPAPVAGAGASWSR